MKFRHKPSSLLLWFLSFAFIFLGPHFGWSQVFYSVNFNNGCAAGCLAGTYGGWTTLNNVGGANGGSPNFWVVSCAENGVIPPGCGAGCSGDASLHIGSDIGDMGASFNETGPNNATYTLARSPIINTTGYFSITLNFDFIAYGGAACGADRAELWLSTDGGATWPAGYRVCLLTVCCGACNGYNQGRWTLYNAALPAAFDNNPNVRIGFHWRNNGNGVGTDPSVAIDDIRLSSVLLPVELLSFQGRFEDSKVNLKWETTKEINLSVFEIERSADQEEYFTLGSVDPKGAVSGSTASYQFEDNKPSLDPAYYRLKMIDQDGKFAYSEIVRIAPGSASALELLSFSPLVNQGPMTVNLWSVAPVSANIELYDPQGKLVKALPSRQLSQGENKLSLDLSSVSSGIYFLKIKTVQTIPGYDPAEISEKFVVVK